VCRFRTFPFISGFCPDAAPIFSQSPMLFFTFFQTTKAPPDQTSSKFFSFFSANITRQRPSFATYFCPPQQGSHPCENLRSLFGLSHWFEPIPPDLIVCTAPHLSSDFSVELWMLIFIDFFQIRIDSVESCYGAAEFPKIAFSRSSYPTCWGLPATFSSL